MKSNTLLVGFVILTLLIGFSSSNFTNLAFADDDEDRIKKELQRMEKYREDQKEKQEKHKKETKEKRDEYRKDTQEKRDEYRKDTKEKYDEYRTEIKEKHEKYREEISERKHEIKSKYNELKDDYTKKYHDLKDELKNQFRALKQNSFDLDSSAISEEDILAFEAKRIELEELKKEFREKILELKTQARQDLEKLKQDYVVHEEERKIKTHDKLNDLKQKYKDRIKDIKKHRLQVILSSNSYTDSQLSEYKYSICHESGKSDNYHTISVSVNAVPAHMRHGDYMGPCNGNVLYDDDTEDFSEEFEYKVRAETLENQSEVKLELEFATETTSYATIVNEIIANFALDEVNAGILLKIQQDDDGELEEKFEIEIENKDGYSEVEVELRFVLNSTIEGDIIAAIVDRSQLTAALVKIGLENEIGEDEDESDDEDDDDEDD